LIRFDGEISTSGAGGSGYWYDMMDVIDPEKLDVVKIGRAKFQLPVFEDSAA
jgi:hypothetical protein